MFTFLLNMYYIKKTIVLKIGKTIKNISSHIFIKIPCHHYLVNKKRLEK